MSFAYLLWFEEISTPLVHRHLARLTAVTLATEAPYTVVAFLAVGRLESLGNETMSVDPTNFLPTPCPTTLVDTHCGGGYHGDAAVTTVINKYVTHCLLHGRVCPALGDSPQILHTTRVQEVG